MWKLDYSQVSGEAWEPLTSMFTHVLFSTQAALMGVPESQDLSLHRRASSSPFRYSAGHLWAEVTLLSLQPEGEDSQAAESGNQGCLEAAGTQGAWASVNPWSQRD